MFLLPLSIKVYFSTLLIYYNDLKVPKIYLGSIGMQLVHSQNDIEVKQIKLNHIPSKKINFPREIETCLITWFYNWLLS